MKKASISEAKNNLSALLDRVKAGASVLIVDRGRPVAQLTPVADVSDDDDRLASLVRAGIVRPARESPSVTTLRGDPPRARKGASALRVLLEDRHEGR